MHIWKHVASKAIFRRSSVIAHLIEEASILILERSNMNSNVVSFVIAIVALSVALIFSTLKNIRLDAKIQRDDQAIGACFNANFNTITERGGYDDQQTWTEFDLVGFDNCMHMYRSKR